MHRRSFIAAALLGFAALAGCGPRWRVVTQASPDTFVGQRYFALMPIDYVGLFILDQREDQYLRQQGRGRSPALRGGQGVHQRGVHEGPGRRRPGGGRRGRAVRRPRRRRS